MMKLRAWNNIEREARPKIRYWIPAAAVDFQDLELELKELKARGFGGVEVVNLSMIPEEILLGEDGWGTEHWKEMIRFIARTVKDLDMTLDIANGPMWPISMPNIESADDPAALYELTFGVLDVPDDGLYTGRLPERRVVHEEGTSVLIQVMAYAEVEKGILKRDSFVDLMPYVTKDEMVTAKLGRAPEGGHWLIFAFYAQPAVHKTGKDQYYVVDHLSKAGAKACEDFWDKIMKESETFASMESFFCDSLEYQVMMDWTPLFAEEFEKHCGYSVLPYLPVVGQRIMYPQCDVPEYVFDDRRFSDMIKHDYLETLTRCYCENHLDVLERMAEKYGKTIRYQVAYNKPFEGERCPLYVSIPENEALGRPALDYQKTMASAVHLGRKKRYSFECAAEFGNAYGQFYDDLMWWVKRSQMAGMNAQVFHGASYSGGYHGKYAVEGTMRDVFWPGYEGFGKGCSNYWNRTLSIEDARGVLDTIARQNTLFLKKKKVDCAIYRQSYTNDGMGSEFCFYPDDGKLSNRGYSYETISPFLLELPVCKVTDGMIDAEGVGYQALIIPSQSSLSKTCIRRLEEFLEAGLKIVWIGEAAGGAYYFSEVQTAEEEKEWDDSFQRFWNNEKLIHAECMQSVPDLLLENGIMPRVLLSGNMDLVTATHVDEKEHICYHMIYAYNRVSCTPDDPNPDEISCSAAYHKGTTKGSYVRAGLKSRSVVPVTLKGHGAVYQCDPWTGNCRPISFNEKEGYLVGQVELEEDEMVILAVFADEPGVEGDIYKTVREIPVKLSELNLQSFEPDVPAEKSFLRSHTEETGVKYEITELLPWSMLDEKLKKFAGKGTYTGTIYLEDKDEDSHYELHLGMVQDTFHVEVNGIRTEFPDQVLKKVDVTSLVHEGENSIKVEVVSNLYNRVQQTVTDTVFPFPIPYVEKKYGIWEEGEEKCVLYEKR